MAQATASTGVVLDVAGDTVTVALELGGQEALQRMRHVSCSVGDLAHITTVGRARFVDGVVGSSPAATSDPQISVPPPAPEDVSNGSWTFGPINPSTWRDGSWRTDTTLLWQGAFGLGAPQYGAAWYAEGPSSLPGDLTDASLTLTRVQGGFGLIAPTVALFAGLGQPDGEPVVIDSTAGPALDLNVPVDWPLPDAWLPFLGNGSAGGLGCYVPAIQPALALTTDGAGMSLTCRWED